MQARFVSGDYTTIPYTPVGAISAGDVIVEGDTTLIAHHDIPAGYLGAVAAGGGVYEAIALTGDTIALGKRLYWDDSNNNAEESATSNVQLGFSAEAKDTGDVTIRFVHVPLI